MKEKFSNHFVSLDELVYTPLYSVAQSNLQLSNSVMELIASTGSSNPVDEKDTIHLKSVNLAYEQINNDGENGKVIEEVGLRIPLISIVPISNLQVKKSKIAFDAEIKRMKKSKSSNKCSMEARVCSSGKQRRRDDGLPKVSFEIELENVPVPEGMARFVDILNANPIPETLSSNHINDSGEVVTGEKAEYYRSIKALKQRESKLNYMGEKLLGTISSKKLNFDRLLRESGIQNTFDTLFAADEEKNIETLKRISEGSDKKKELNSLYSEIRDAMNTYRIIMDKTMELSDRIIQAELEHIREEINDGEQKEGNA